MYTIVYTILDIRHGHVIFVKILGRNLIKGCTNIICVTSTEQYLKYKSQ